MKLVFLFSIVLALSSAESFAGVINICDRGRFGDFIAQAAGASSCEAVREEDMAKIQSLHLVSVWQSDIPENLFTGMPALTDVSLVGNRITYLRPFGASLT